MAIKFTDEQIQEIERLALMNCNSNTIAEATGIAITTLKRRFGRKLRHCWAIHRVNLRASQDKLKDISADMAKFLGKQVLGQTDKQVIETGPIDVKTKTGRELDATKAAARAYNEAMSRGDDKPQILPIERA
jgi:hypothetical protein